MAYLKLLDVYGDASALVIVDGSQVSFGALTPPYSEVVYASLTWRITPQPWVLWAWDGVGLQPVEAQPAASCLARLMDVPTSLRIFEFVHDSFSADFHTPPFDLDYRRALTGRLQRELATIVRGEVQLIKYWASAVVDPTTGAITYSDLVLSEAYTYTRDAYGFARERNLVITWYDRAGAPHATTKTMHKIYEAYAGRRGEGVKKRRLNTEIIEMSTIGAMVLSSADAASILYQMTYTQVVDRGKELLAQYSEEKYAYISEETSAFKVGIQTHNIVTDPNSAWLEELMPPGDTQTYRTYIVGELS